MFVKNIPPQLLLEKQATASVEELILGNIKLVICIAHQYSDDPWKVDDLIQEGMIGLQRAAQLFNPNRGASFGTYAAYWIKQSIRRWIRSNRSLIKIPFYHYEKKNNIGRRYKQYVANALTGIDSINDILEDEEKDIKDENAESPAFKCELGEFNGIIRKIMQEALTERERIILSERFNLDNEFDKVPTLDELGERFNLTRERIRQIEQLALEKMRKKLQLVRYGKIHNIFS